jgi:hypothetical protein
MVWPAGPMPIDPDASWPMPIVSAIVASFSESGGRGVLVPWPAPQSTTRSVPGERCGFGVVGVDGVIDHAPGADPDTGNDSANDTEVSDVAVSESPCIPNGLTLVRWLIVVSVPLMDALCEYADVLWVAVRSIR